MKMRPEGRMMIARDFDRWQGLGAVELAGISIPAHRRRLYVPRRPVIIASRVAVRRCGSFSSNLRAFLSIRRAVRRSPVVAASWPRAA